MNDCIAQYSELTGNETEDQVKLIKKRAKLICKLKEHRKFYTVQKKIYNMMWLSLTLISITFGLLTSASIIADISKISQMHKVALAIISIIPIISTAYLQNFNIRGLFELRESAICTIDRLIEKTKRIKTNDKDEFEINYNDVCESIISLSENQSKGFFAVIGKKPSSTNFS